ncbi:MAG TPA: DUF3108 domain-containing protein [Chthoniobacterales bacterium]
MSSPVATSRPQAHARAPACLQAAIAIWLGASLLTLTAAAPAPAEWEKTVTIRPRGAFPNPRQLVGIYDFGWSELVAATAEIRVDDGNGNLRLDGDGATVGVVRALWKFDTHHRAVADAKTLHPISMHEVDEKRRKTLVTDLVFKPGSVERVRTDTSAKKPAEPKKFEFSHGLFDMFSALLYIRSQPLKKGDVYRIVVYPATNAYLATLTVADRGPITVGAGEYPAIKLDVQLKKVGKHRELEPHKKFRRASVWVSDDADRLLLRIEASIFVGSVFAELQSVRFPEKSVASANMPNDKAAPIPRDKPAVQETAPAAE